MIASLDVHEVTRTFSFRRFQIIEYLSLEAVNRRSRL